MHITEREMHAPDLDLEQSLLYWQNATEIALQTHFGRSGDPETASFAGKLSTIPERVHSDINSTTLLDVCPRFSQELHVGFATIGIQTEILTSEDSEREHLYLAPVYNPHDIVIDPSIGQIIVGHNHAFANTRTHLRQLIHMAYNGDHGYTISWYFPYSPNKLMRRLWGQNPISGEPFINPLQTENSQLATEISLASLVREIPIFKRK